MSKFLVLRRFKVFEVVDDYAKYMLSRGSDYYVLENNTCFKNVQDEVCLAFFKKSSGTISKPKFTMFDPKVVHPQDHSNDVIKVCETRKEAEIFIIAEVLTDGVNEI